MQRNGPHTAHFRKCQIAVRRYTEQLCTLWAHIIVYQDLNLSNCNARKVQPQPNAKNDCSGANASVNTGFRPMIGRCACKYQPVWRAIDGLVQLLHRNEPKQLPPNRWHSTFAQLHAPPYTAHSDDLPEVHHHICWRQAPTTHIIMTGIPLDVVRPSFCWYPSGNQI